MHCICKQVNIFIPKKAHHTNLHRLVSKHKWYKRIPEWMYERYMDHFHIVVFEKCCGLENETKCNNILLVYGSQCTIFHVITISFHAFIFHIQKAVPFILRWIHLRSLLICITLYDVLLASTLYFYFYPSSTPPQPSSPIPQFRLVVEWVGQFLSIVCCLFIHSFTHSFKTKR